MDADCLIKLTKAHLKEEVCAATEIVVPLKVREEVMTNASEHAECSVVQRNLDRGLLREVADPQPPVRGEDAALAVYQAGGYAGIASDDKRFIRRLQLLGVPYITPAVFILLLVRQRCLDVEEGLDRLSRIAHMVSDDETAVVRLKLEAYRAGGR